MYDYIFCPLSVFYFLTVILLLPNWRRNVFTMTARLKRLNVWKYCISFQCLTKLEIRASLVVSAHRSLAVLALSQQQQQQQQQHNWFTWRHPIIQFVFAICCNRHFVIFITYKLCCKCVSFCLCWIVFFRLYSSSNDLRARFSIPFTFTIWSRKVYLALYKA